MVSGKISLLGRFTTDPPVRPPLHPPGDISTIALHLTNTFLWIRCKYVYVCNPCFAASMFSTLTNLWLFTLHNTQARLVSRLELCPLFRKFWSAPWDSGWIVDHSGSLLHQKYHPQISAGLLSRKSTIGSPSLSGASPGSGFRSGYLRIRWWAALKLDPGNCFFENRHTGGLILLWHT